MYQEDLKDDVPQAVPQVTQLIKLKFENSIHLDKKESI